MPQMIFDPVDMWKDREHKTLRNQVLQEQITDSQQERKNQAEVKQILDKPIPPLLQQGMNAELGDPGTTDRTPVIQSLQQQGLGLIQKAQAIQSRNPKLANQMFDQAKELEDRALRLGVEQAKEEKEVKTDIANWMGTVKDQASLDAARQALDSRHRGLWDEVKLPKVYDAKTAPQFRQWSLASLTATQQAEADTKLAESIRADRYYEARAKKEEADAVYARTREAKEQQKLKKDNTMQTLENKRIDMERVEDQKYAVDKKKIELEALKKFPVRMEKKWFQDPEDANAERRTAYVTEGTGKLTTAYHESVAAVDKWADSHGLVPRTRTNQELPKAGGTKKTAGLSKEEVISKLKGANPDLDDTELEEYAKTKGYF